MSTFLHFLTIFGISCVLEAAEYTGVTFCQLPESCCFWSFSLADVMWFFLPARSSEPANSVNTALISPTGLPLGESTYSCQRPSPLGRAGPCHLLTAQTPKAKAALPQALVSDSKAWPASISRSCLLIAVDQKALNMSIKTGWRKAEQDNKDLAFTMISHFLLDRWLSLGLLVLLDELAGHFLINTINTAMDFRVHLYLPSPHWLFSFLSFVSFLSKRVCP